MQIVNPILIMDYLLGEEEDYLEEEENYLGEEGILEEEVVEESPKIKK